MDTFSVVDYFEELIVDRKRRFFLTINNLNKEKEVTEDQAKEWYIGRYSKSKWEKVRKEIDQFCREVS